MKQKTIYISGKMGEKVLSAATIEKFQRAQDKLLKEGWAVINPASEKYQRDTLKQVTIESKKWRDFKWGGVRLVRMDAVMGYALAGHLRRHIHAERLGT